MSWTNHLLLLTLCWKQIKHAFFKDSRALLCVLFIALQHISRKNITNCMFVCFLSCCSRVCVYDIWSDSRVESPEPWRSVSIMLICLEMNTDISGPAADPLHIYSPVLITRCTCKSLQRKFSWLRPAVTKMLSGFISHYLRAGCVLCPCPRGFFSRAQGFRWQRVFQVRRLSFIRDPSVSCRAFIFHEIPLNYLPFFSLLSTNGLQSCTHKNTWSLTSFDGYPCFWILWPFIVFEYYHSLLWC